MYTCSRRSFTIPIFGLELSMGSLYFHQLKKIFYEIAAYYLIAGFLYYFASDYLCYFIWSIDMARV